MLTYMETQKRDALTCYKSFDAYSGLTVRWAEMGFVIADEFRDGNISPAQGNHEALVEAITHVNELGIEDVWVRSDSAAHQERILKTLSEWKIDGPPEAGQVRHRIQKDQRVPKRGSPPQAGRLPVGEGL